MCVCVCQPQLKVNIDIIICFISHVSISSLSTLYKVYGLKPERSRVHNSAFCFLVFLLIIILPSLLTSLVCVFSIFPSCVHSVVFFCPCFSHFCDCLLLPKCVHLCLVSLLYLSPVLPFVLVPQCSPCYLAVFHHVVPFC